jgi:hypothetical protein
MQNIIELKLSDNRLKSIVLNVFAISLIYFTPTISHVLGMPFYLFEPMRIMLILALVHTNRFNAYFLAITLPLVSFMFSGHPFFPKVVLIGIELLLNVFLFYKFSSIIKNTFISVGLSIIISKVIYYLLKYMLISSMIINSDLISTPIYIQLITTLLLAAYAFIIISYNRKKFV